uniref:Inositol-3-phosphate synthase n=1 Tax=Megaselia scalaris TaxID=36166 RepID=T1GWJ0_MEGSC
MFTTLVIEPETLTLNLRTDRKVPKLGVMLVGWGGNNGSTLTAALEANRRKLQWRKRTGVQTANWFGSITQASTVLIGHDDNGKDVYLPMNELVPMVNPDDIDFIIF